MPRGKLKNKMFHYTPAVGEHLKTSKRPHTPKNSLPSHPGRHLKPINWDEVRDMAQTGCTAEEIAQSQGVTKQTLYKYSEFFTMYKQGYVEGNKSLRRTTFEMAVKGKNVPLIIFLNKVRLGLNDQPAANPDNTLVQMQPQGTVVNWDDVPVEDLELLVEFRRRQKSRQAAQTIDVDAVLDEGALVKVNGVVKNGKVK